MNDHSPYRLLPWTEDGRTPCYLSTHGTGPVTRHADHLEELQLALADKLLSHAEDVLDKPDCELAPYTRQLTEALRDALRIAECRRERLTTPESPAVEAARATLTHAGTPTALTLLTLPGEDLASAPAARHHLTAIARAWGLPPDLVDALETVTGELVANALEHSDSWGITVTLARTGKDSVTVGVTDEGEEDGDDCPTRAIPHTPSPDQESGRGLLITAALATRWGQHRTPTSLTVWAELEATR